MLIFDYRHAFGVRIAWGGGGGGEGIFLESIRAGRLSPWFSGLVSVCLLPVWYHGFELIVVSLLFCMFSCRMAKVKKRLPPARWVASVGLPGGCLLQAASSSPYLWRS